MGQVSSTKLSFVAQKKKISTTCLLGKLYCSSCWDFSFYQITPSISKLIKISKSLIQYQIIPSTSLLLNFLTERHVISNNIVKHIYIPQSILSLKIVNDTNKKGTFGIYNRPMKEFSYYQIHLFSCTSFKENDYSYKLKNSCSFRIPMEHNVSSQKPFFFSSTPYIL